MAYKTYKGWYKLENPEKFVPPGDRYMKSFNESAQAIHHKSGLEQKSFLYCDKNPNIKYWSVEPFPIHYLKPTTGKIHRYYIDLFIEYEDGRKFLVEVKSSHETKPPKEPKKKTAKGLVRYQRAMNTWLVNSAKWEAAKAFCEERKMTFAMLTEVQLNKIKS